MENRHVNPDPDADASGVPADDAWLRLSAALTAQINPVAGREDLLVVCEPGAGRGAPACMIREHATVEINGDHLGVDPRTIDTGDPDARERFPVLWGLGVHEAAHARHSLWDFGSGPPAAAEAAVVLEESRIEAAQVRRRPGDRRWLRAATTGLLLGDVPRSDSPWGAAHAAALILGRVDAGVLDPDEAQPVRAAVTAILGQPTVDTLTGIWRDAHRTGDDDTGAMVSLGRRWCAALGVDPAGDAPDSGGDGTGAAGAGGTLHAAAGRVVAVVVDHDGEEARAAAEAARRAERRAAARQAEADDRGRVKDAGGTVFGPPGSPGTGVTPQGRRRPGTVPAERTATEEERSTARRLARALRAAAHREPTSAAVTSPMPPGRLRARVALSADAQRAAGQQPTAEPWSLTRRRRVPDPPIQVGICLDVSASVASFAPAIASAAWIVARATAWAHGTSATVTFGRYVTPVVHPGSPPDTVRLYHTEPNTVGFPLAVDALDGALRLSDRRAGARLLVLVSDGEFVQGERISGHGRLQRLRRSGCALLWLAPPDSSPLPGCELVVLDDPARSGQIIARAATAALTALR